MHTEEIIVKFNLFLSALFIVLTPLTASSEGRLPDTPIGQVHACDLIDESTVVTVFGAPIQQRYPNRQNQMMDGAIFSNCSFHTARNNLKTLLFDFPTAADASRAFSRFTTNGQYSIHQPLSGLGDAGSWWHIGTEAYGLTVQKGKRIYILDTRWDDSKPEAGLKDRLKPVAVRALQKL